MKDLITDTDGLLYRPEVFRCFSPATRGNLIYGYFARPKDGVAYTTFDKREIDSSFEPTVIAAPPGYFLLQIVVSDDNRFERLTRDAVIALNVTSSGVTPIGLEVGLNDGLPILRPDGAVQAGDMRYENEADYVQEIRAHERYAKTAANQA